MAGMSWGTALEEVGNDMIWREVARTSVVIGVVVGVIWWKAKTLKKVVVAGKDQLALLGWAQEGFSWEVTLQGNHQRWCCRRRIWTCCNPQDVQLERNTY